jgi:hypothetical protein
MTHSTSWKGFKLETPATYRIRVQGRLDLNWGDRLGGMAISEDTSAVQPPVTILAGHLVDQAALSGILNTLYELHLPLLSVKNLDEKKGARIAALSSLRKPIRGG